MTPQEMCFCSFGGWTLRYVGYADDREHAAARAVQEMMDGTLDADRVRVVQVIIWDRYNRIQIVQGWTAAKRLPLNLTRDGDCTVEVQVHLDIRRG